MTYLELDVSFILSKAKLSSRQIHSYWPQKTIMFKSEEPDAFHTHFKLFDAKTTPRPQVFL